MKLKTTLFLGSALLLGASLVQAASVDKAGADNRVEWQIQSNWLVDTQPVDMVHSLDGKKVFILNNEHRVLVYNNKGELQGRIPVGEGVNRIDIAPQGEALYLIDEEANSFTSVALRYVVDIDTAGSPFKGKSDAPVTIAVFTDFE